MQTSRTCASMNRIDEEDRQGITMRVRAWTHGSTSAEDAGPNHVLSAGKYHACTRHQRTASRLFSGTRAMCEEQKWVTAHTSFASGSEMVSGHEFMLVSTFRAKHHTADARENQKFPHAVTRAALDAVHERSDCPRTKKARSISGRSGTRRSRAEHGSPHSAENDPLKNRGNHGSFSEKLLQEESCSRWRQRHCKAPPASRPSNRHPQPSNILVLARLQATRLSKQTQKVDCGTANGSEHCVAPRNHCDLGKNRSTLQVGDLQADLVPKWEYEPSMKAAAIMALT